MFAEGYTAVYIQSLKFLGLDFGVPSLISFLSQLILIHGDTVFSFPKACSLAVGVCGVQSRYQVLAKGNMYYVSSQAVQ